MIYIYSLYERVLDIWLIKQKITGFFIIFNTNTTFIDRPIDLSVLPVQILLPFVLSSVRHSPVFYMSFVYLSITKLLDKINNSIYTTLGRPALISALGYLLPTSILQFYSFSSSLSLLNPFRDKMLFSAFYYTRAFFFYFFFIFLFFL